MLSTLLGLDISHVTVLREEQCAKQSSPKLVTEEGIVMDVKEEQFSKHLYPKLVTEEGMVTDVREEHPLKQ